MKKDLVVCYSNTGNNRYLAEKIARRLDCEIEAIRPRINAFPLLLLMSAMKMGAGIKSLGHPPEEYGRIILCGPIWMGKFISPLRGFIKKYHGRINKLIFVSCCGSSDAAKNEKFGHGLVFKLIEGILGDKLVFCEAFPIGLVLPEDKQKDGNTIMKTRLSDDNFIGVIQERFDKFIRKITE